MIMLVVFYGKAVFEGNFGNGIFLHNICFFLDFYLVFVYNNIVIFLHLGGKCYYGN